MHMNTVTLGAAYKTKLYLQAPKRYETSTNHYRHKSIGIYVTPIDSYYKNKSIVSLHICVYHIDIIPRQQQPVKSILLF